MDTDNFAHRLTTARKAAGYSQSAFSQAIGWSQPVVCSWETGKAYPTLRALPRIAELLDLELVELVELIAAERDTAVAS